MAISIKASIGLRRRRAWNEFLVWVDRHQEDRWIFRGVADAKKHFLVPKIGRKAQVYSEPKELTIFRNFRRRARQFATIDGLSDWDLLALAQHHGLPTRLLDWSINPLIAAYFAVASSPHDTDARVYAAVAPRMIKTEIDVDPFQPKFVRSFVPSAVTARIVSQRGLFTVHPSPTSAWCPKNASDLDYFDIGVGDREFFQAKLFQFAIEASTIRADLDGICDTLAWQFEHDVGVGAFNF